MRNQNSEKLFVIKSWPGCQNKELYLKNTLVTSYVHTVSGGKVADWGKWEGWINVLGYLYIIKLEKFAKTQ